MPLDLAALAFLAVAPLLGVVSAPVQVPDPQVAQVAQVADARPADQGASAVQDAPPGEEVQSDEEGLDAFLLGTGRDWLAEYEGVTEHLEELRADRIEALVERAELFDDVGLERARDAVLTALLYDDQDDRRLRRRLGYRKRGSGWTREDYVLPPKAEGVQEEALDAVVEAAREDMEWAAVLRDLFPERERGYDWRDLLLFLHMMRGLELIAPASERGREETQWGTYHEETGRWWSKGTSAWFSSRERVEWALTRVESWITDAELDAYAAAAPPDFTGVVETRLGLFASVDGTQRARDLASVTDRVGVLVREVLSINARQTFPEGVLVYELGPDADAEAFAAGHPEAMESRRVATPSALRFGPRHILVQGGSAEEREWSFAVAYVDLLLSESFPDTSDAPWIQQGVLARIVELAQGEEPHVGPASDERSKLATAMAKSDADWLRLAEREFGRRIDREEIERIATLPMEDLKARDRLLAYLFGVYVVDAAPKSLRQALELECTPDQRIARLEVACWLPLPIIASEFQWWMVDVLED